MKNKIVSLNRRRFLIRAAELGTLIIASPLSIAAASNAFTKTKTKTHPTPPNALGPFYKRNSPNRNILRAPGDPGLPLKLSGKVYSEKGFIFHNATLEIWQTDANGIYDTVGNRYRTKILPGSEGTYNLESVMPGHYPARV